MAFCSFGGKDDPCSAVKWASHDTVMMPLVSWQRDVSTWPKDSEALALPGAKIVPNRKVAVRN